MLIQKSAVWNVSEVTEKLRLVVFPRYIMAFFRYKLTASFPNQSFFSRRIPEQKTLLKIFLNVLKFF